jgi:hypothetical protein
MTDRPPIPPGSWLSDIGLFLAWTCGLSLTLAAILAGAVTVWRFGADLGGTRPFPVMEGPFAHYPVWVAITVGTQTAAFFLKRWVAKQPPRVAATATSRDAVRSITRSEAATAAV